jgi:hypothetical protein
MNPREVPIVVRGHVPPEQASLLRPELGSLRTLAHVLSWLRRQLPPRDVSEIVTQDEYTHDVVVAWQANLVLVFDTT